MLVYGDARRRESPRQTLEGLARAATELGHAPAGIQRHAAWVSVLIEVGELAQGLLDHAFAEQKRDEPSALADASGALALEAARRVVQSFESGFADAGCFDPAPIQRLGALDLPAEVTLKVAEGYAFYALYPELYALAAARARQALSDAWVIGIRSIGTSLASIVAAALRTTRPVLHVRPVGHPFNRELSLSNELLSALGKHAGTFAIVDEGPGMSGSSFSAVADLLERLGVPASRVHFFPSHGNDLGPQASEKNRARWRSAHKHLADAGELLAGLPGWVQDVTGPAEGPPEELSGGAWRAHVYPSPGDWPGVHVQQERRKLLLRAGGRRWLLKFAGLGRYGEHRWRRAQALQAAGFIPPVAALRHGFLVQEWLVEAKPLPLAPGFDRRKLLRQLGEYLAFLHQRFRSDDADSGASPEELLKMARFNAEQRLGPELARTLDRWAPQLGGLTTRIHRVQTDNKLQPWEWLVLPDGRLLKADALDHHQAHDLVGCQDIAWDVAGASVELGLSAGEQREMAQRLERASGARLDPEKLAFHTDCYLAFQLGFHVQAVEVLGAAVPEEAWRLALRARHYESLLQARLEA